MKVFQFEYVLDPDTRKRIDLPQEKKLKLEQLERKYLSEERCDRIAEEIRKNSSYGEKMIIFGVSQAHCYMLCKALNNRHSAPLLPGISIQVNIAVAE